MEFFIWLNCFTKTWLKFKFEIQLLVGKSYVSGTSNRYNYSKTTIIPSIICAKIKI